MIEVLTVPTKAHQAIVLFFCRILVAYLGEMAQVLPAPYHLRLRSGKYREPDLLFSANGSSNACSDGFGRLLV